MTRLPLAIVSRAIASRTLIPVLLLAGLVACGDEEGGPGGGNACDDYVDYMCDCHGDEYDCSDLRNTYADPTSDDLDECQIALEDQEASDDETGHECVADTGTPA